MIATAEEAPAMGFLDHLDELRRRLLWCVGTVGVVFLLLFLYSPDIYDLLAIPLMQSMGEKGHLIATEITSPLVSPLKLVLIVSLYLSMPVIFYHAWRYVAPALYRDERRLVLPLLVISCLLFYSGLLFCYFVAFPLMFNFIHSVVPSSVIITPDMHQYLGFTLKMLFSFGLTFQVPVLVVLLIRMGLVTREKLAAKRRHMILVALTVGMILTPPDVLSQVLLAVPIQCLFELGLVLSRLLPAKAD